MTDVVRCLLGFGDRICEPDEFERLDLTGTVVGEAGQHSTSSLLVPSMFDIVLVNGSSMHSFCSVESLSEEAELGAFWISDIFRADWFTVVSKTITAVFGKIDFVAKAYRDINDTPIYSFHSITTLV